VSPVIGILTRQDLLAHNILTVFPHLSKSKRKWSFCYQIWMNGQAALLGQFSLFNMKLFLSFALFGSCMEKKIQHWCIPYSIFLIFFLTGFYLVMRSYRLPLLN